MPDPKRINPISGAKNIFGPNAALRGLQVGLQGRHRRRGDLRLRRPEGHAARRDGRRLADRAGRRPQLGHPLHRAAGRRGLPRPRRSSTTPTSATAPRRASRWTSRRSRRSPRARSSRRRSRARIRRRQMQQARARMMQAVPEADVVVTNPTHFAVALKYDGSRPAPQVVAKGQDLVALRDPRARRASTASPRARGQAAGPRPARRPCEVGHEIPEEFFAAVAQVLAFVYRARAGRRRSPCRTS